jgi:hypothetical protein
MKPQSHRAIYPPGHQATGPLGYRATDPQCHRFTGPPSHRFTHPPDHRITGSLGHQATDHPPIGSPEPLGHLGHHSATLPFGSPGSPKHQGYWVTYPPHRPGLKPQTHLSIHIQDPGLGLRIRSTDPEPNTRARATTHNPQTQDPRATEPQITDLGSWISPIDQPQSSKKPGSHLAP